MRLSIMIVDDEALARRRLADILNDVGDSVPHHIVAEADSGLAALEALDTLRASHVSVDLIFLDIRMPGMDGLELAGHLLRQEKPPRIIFVTAYEKHALQAFELNAVDYLLKPVRAERLLNALNRLPQKENAPLEKALQSLGGGRSHLSCHERGRLLLVPVIDILYLKADVKYVLARTQGREYLLDESLTQLEAEFPDRFVRLHRSVLVARDAIIGFEKSAGEDSETQWQALVQGLPDRLPVSRRQWPIVREYAKHLVR